MPVRFPLFAAPAVLLAALTLSGPPQARAAQFVPLGDLPGGRTRSEAFGLSGDGSTVVGKSAVAPAFGSGFVFESFRWTAALGMQRIDSRYDENSFSALAWDASYDGSVVVGEAPNATDKTEAYRWTAAGGVERLGFLWVDPKTEIGLLSLGERVSADGSTVVGKSRPDPVATNQSQGEAYAWTAETGMLGLGDLPGGIFNSRAQGISADATVIVGFSIGSQGTTSFVWTADQGIQDTGGLPGGSTFSEARGISADGSTILGFSSSTATNFDTEECTPDIGSRVKVEAHRQVDGTTFPLGDLPGGCYDGMAFDASADGSVIVGFSNTDLGNEAFVWDAANGMRRLQQVLIDDYGLGDDVEGWVLEEARAISDDGLAIAGTGTNPAGDIEAFYVSLPEPDAGSLAAVAVAAVTASARRRRRRRRPGAPVSP